MRATCEVVSARTSQRAGAQAVDELEGLQGLNSLPVPRAAIQVLQQRGMTNSKP